MGRRAVISVLVPVYNLENRIEACLAALQASRFPDFEVLCLDDGSTDATPALLDAAAARDPRFRVFHLPHRGVSAARNFGLDHAVGDYLTFVDGDDQLHCCFLGALLDAARRTGAAMTIARHPPGRGPSVNRGFVSSPHRNFCVTSKKSMCMANSTPAGRWQAAALLRGLPTARMWCLYWTCWRGSVNGAKDWLTPIHRSISIPRVPIQPPIRPRPRHGPHC